MAMLKSVFEHTFQNTERHIDKRVCPLGVSEKYIICLPFTLRNCLVWWVFSIFIL